MSAVVLESLAPLSLVVRLHPRMSTVHALPPTTTYTRAGAHRPNKCSNLDTTPPCRFNVYVAQPEVKPGCVLRRSNVNVLESRSLVTSQEVRDGEGWAG